MDFPGDESARDNSAGEGARIAARDRFLLAALPNVAFDGWSAALFRATGRTLGLSEAEWTILFPRGASDLVAWFSHWADREMSAAIGSMDFPAMRVTEKVAAAVAARLAVLEPYKDAARRAASLLGWPTNLPLGARLLYETVDTIWRAAGDQSTDFNFYTKRGLLAPVYGATILYWLDDDSAGGADTKAFLARRLADVMAVPRFGARLNAAAANLPNPLSFLRAAQRR